MESGQGSISHYQEPVEIFVKDGETLYIYSMEDVLQEFYQNCEKLFPSLTVIRPGEVLEPQKGTYFLFPFSITIKNGDRNPEVFSELLYPEVFTQEGVFKHDRPTTILNPSGNHILCGCEACRALLKEGQKPPKSGFWPKFSLILPNFYCDNKLSKISTLRTSKCVFRNFFQKTAQVFKLSGITKIDCQIFSQVIDKAYLIFNESMIKNWEEEFGSNRSKRTVLEIYVNVSIVGFCK